MRRAILAAAFLFAALASAADRPSILWIVFEDISPEIGPYGDPYAITPRLDRFARESVLYNRAYSNGGACAPARSTLISGMYPPSIGTHHMRSEGVPPPQVRAFTEWLREAGYYTSNHAKTDYNWIAPPTAWDAQDADWRTYGWRKRGGKPFFTVVNIFDTHSSQTYHPWADWPKRREALAPEQRHDPARAAVPPFYPDTPETREILARYADNVTYADRLFGEVLDTLAADGLADDTIVFFYGDHGTGLPRSKSFQFDSATRVPLMIRFPRKFDHLAPARPGGRVERLTGFIDFAPTVLALAGVEPPAHFQGRPFLGSGAGLPPQYVHGYRDRMDERCEFIRSTADGRFRYLRNYFPHLPWFHQQSRLYEANHPILNVWHALAKAGKLTEAAAVYMARSKPHEQLFDLREDPHEVRDVAADPRYEGVLRKLRRANRDWMFSIRDLGYLPEEEMWRRFDGAAAAAIAADRSLYPMERIAETADLVGTGDGAVAEQVRRLADPDPTVRFWAAVGLRAHDAPDASARAALARALSDESPAVQVVAAETLCRVGDCERPLAVLLERLKDARPYVALRAANAIDHLDERARPLTPVLTEMAKPVEGLEDKQSFFGTATYPERIAYAVTKRWREAGR